MRSAGAAIGFVVVALLVCPPTFAHAQTRKRDARLASLVAVAPPPAADSGEASEAPLLTLRPAPGLELLAHRVARVLALRFGVGSIRVGGPPPPGLIEAVPAGHLALAREGDRVHLVLGAAFGAFFEASVPLAKTASEPDVRSLALAVEALRDRVVEAAERSNEPLVVAQPTAVTTRQAADSESPPRDRGPTMPMLPGAGEGRQEVKPMFFVRAYSGASNQSSGPRMGIATGGGMCVQGHCLVIGFESPLPGVLQASATDVRYRYPTITSSFYSRPWQFGIFAPAASIGFLSRVGYFRRDMGISANSEGLDTDLGVRGALEGSFGLGGAFEFTSELGLDYALDRWQLGSGETVTRRGDRATLWAQAGLRLRPY